jgi:hypothetical protein
LATRSFALTLAVVGAVTAACIHPSDDAHAPIAVTRPRVEVIAESTPLPVEQLAAFRGVAEHSAGTSPITGSGAGHDAMGDHTHHEAATGVDIETLHGQLAEARHTARTLMGQPRLSRAGYFIGSYWTAGIGTHYIDWRLVGDAFDPARPAMVLVDTAPGHHRRLAGFSYWVASPNGPPVGFAGDFDTWHNHRGMCFVDGALAREDLPRASDCEGTWIDGGDLWMLHVWVVPGYENPDGLFASTNPKLCGPRGGSDGAQCTVVG